MEEIYILEPVPDRRKQCITVDFERRSGVDRRKIPRLVVSSKIRREILENSSGRINPGSLYSLEHTEDRRQESLPVENERRSGKDRRKYNRFSLDSRIRNDISTFRSMFSAL